MDRRSSDLYRSRARGLAHMSLEDYQTEFVQSATEISNDLWDACFQPSVEGRWWYESLEQSGLEDQFRFLYGLIRYLGRPVGIAPVFAMDVPIDQVAPQEFLRLLRVVGKVLPSILFQRTLFVGSPGLDESRVGVTAGVNRRDALLSFQLGLDKKAKEIGAELIVWKDFPESSSNDFDWLSRQKRLFRVVSYPNTQIEFSSNRKEDYFAALKGTRRRKLKTKLKRSGELAALDVEIVHHPDEKTLDDIFALFWQTYEKSETKFERLNRKFFELMAEKEVTRFVLLREPATQELVAFMLCYELGEWLVNKFIGMDYSRPREWMLYFRLWEAVVDLALSRGFAGIVSGQLCYEAKIEIGHRLVPSYNYCRHRNPFKHYLYSLLAQRIDWASLDQALARFLAAHPEDVAPEAAGSTLKAWFR